MPRGALTRRVAEILYRDCREKGILAGMQYPRALVLLAGLLPTLVACGGSDSAPATLPGVITGEGGGGGGGGAGGGSAGVCAGLTGMPGDFQHTLESGGKTREYRVHVPPGYNPAALTPAVLVFHGYLETAEQIEKISEMSPVADSHSFLAVYPQGLSTSWNAGVCCGTSSSSGVEDVQFVKDMLDALAKEYCVDPKRVFAAGFSNGGMLSHRLACELSDRIAAIGPVAGTMAIDTCAPSRPVPVMHVHGTSDFVVPYNGNGIGGAEAVDATIAGWVERNGCTDPQATGVFEKGKALCVEYSQCKAGAAVRLCTIDGGGHQWPGGTSAGGFGGTLNMDLDSSEAMAAFFEAHPMP